MIFAVSIILAVFLGVALVLFIRSSTAGVLRIDRSDPEKDVYRFEINNLDVLPKKRYIIVKVDRFSDISQD